MRKRCCPVPWRTDENFSGSRRTASIPPFRNSCVHGYAEQSRYDYKAYDFAKGIPEPRLPAGFELLALDSVPRRITNASTTVFGRALTIKVRGDLESFLSVAHVPDFRKDLTYTVRAANGDYCYGSIWLNKANLPCLPEPLCTHPAYRKRGLTRALLYTAMRGCSRWDDLNDRRQRSILQSSSAMNPIYLLRL